MTTVTKFFSFAFVDEENENENDDCFVEVYYFPVTINLSMFDEDDFSGGGEWGMDAEETWGYVHDVGYSPDSEILGYSTYEAPKEDFIKIMEWWRRKFIDEGTQYGFIDVGEIDHLPEVEYSKMLSHLPAS